MANGTATQNSKQKNQLIARSREPQPPSYVEWIKRGGMLLLIISGVWLLLLVFTLTPPHLLHPFSFWPSPEHREHVLHQWAHFGHALAGPFELATLGTIVLSFVHVIHQLRMQEHTLKSQFQPVVTCAALLHYTVEGTDAPGKIKIKNPSLKLRIRNLGDSPAIFIDIEIEDFCFVPPHGETLSLYNALNMKSIYIDSLGRGMTEATDRPYEEIELPTKEDLPDEVKKLIDSILASAPDSDPGILQLKLWIRHENVLRHDYTNRGTFAWSTNLGQEAKSDREQMEYITNFHRARTNNNQETPSIGQLIKQNQPLQAALESYVVPDDNRASLPS
ncbi:MAG: hypothetical protein V7641_2722 [Blastocatellia bacterium]